MKDFDFVLASGAEHLRESIEKLGFRVFSSGRNHDSFRFFPNSDLYTRIDDVAELSGRRVIVVQSCTGSTPAQVAPCNNRYRHESLRESPIVRRHRIFLHRGQ